MKTIDITPTWKGILPTLLLILRDATPEGQAAAIDELRRMADLADRYNESMKKSNPRRRS